MTAMTIWQDNAAAFAERPDETGEQVDHARAAAIGTTIALLKAGRPGEAHYALLRGVRRQWLLTGTGELQLGPETPESEILEAWEATPRSSVPKAWHVLIWPKP